VEKFKPNSHKSKKTNALVVAEDKENREEKKVEKVITGTVRAKKKNKFMEAFFSEEVSSVKSYILVDVLIPAAKKAFSDVITSGIDMILYGENGRRKKNSHASKVSYRSYYDREPERRRTYDALPVRASYSFDDIILDSRGEAEEVFMRMDELIDRYEVVSVFDLFELVGLPTNYTDNKYGWTDIQRAKVIRVRDGYLLQLPKPMPLD